MKLDLMSDEWRSWTPKLQRGLVDYVTRWSRTQEAAEKRSAWALLRAQEHVTVVFLLDDEVPLGEAWRLDDFHALPRWRVSRETLRLWESNTPPDWRTAHMVPEDFYAH